MPKEMKKYWLELWVDLADKKPQDIITNIFKVFDDQGFCFVTGVKESHELSYQEMINDLKRELQIRQRESLKGVFPKEEQLKTEAVFTFPTISKDEKFCTNVRLNLSFYHRKHDVSLFPDDTYYFCLQITYQEEQKHNKLNHYSLYTEQMIKMINILYEQLRPFYGWLDNEFKNLPVSFYQIVRNYLPNSNKLVILGPELKSNFSYEDYDNNPKYTWLESFDDGGLCLHSFS